MADVSRETRPAVAAEILGASLERVTCFGDLLTREGAKRGLIGPREVPRLWERHLLNCAVVVQRIPFGRSVADIGSGAGLPGLVWALMRTDLQVTLVEPLLRRCTFLTEAAETLSASNVTVLRSRAEDVDAQFDAVTARAVASLDKLSEWCIPLVRPGGAFLAMKGQSAAEEVAAARPSLAALGARDITVTAYGPLDPPTVVVEVTR